MINNRIGPNTTAESVDIKEGTSATIVTGNSFDGRGMTAADSWVDAKGNVALISRNTGSHSPRDGFQTHVIVSGWGSGNRFTANHAQVDGPKLIHQIPVEDARVERGFGQREIGAGNRVGVRRLVRVIRVRHEDRRSDPEVRLKLTVRKLRALQERSPEQRVESDHPDREIDVRECSVDAELRTEGAGLPADVRCEVREVDAETEVEWTDVERKPVASA